MQDTTHLIQRQCYQPGSPCQHSAGNGATWRPPDHRKETQTEVIWACLPFIRSGHRHLARHGEKGKKTRQTEEEWWEINIREWMDRPEVRQVPEGSGEQGKWRKLAAKSSVVPHRPLWLRNRWWWWWWHLMKLRYCLSMIIQNKMKHYRLLQQNKPIFWII